jgi:hypothetical protein
MIKRISRGAGLIFSEDACDHVAEVCCDVPYWIRKGCSFIHRKVEVSIRPAEVSVSQVVPYLGSFVATDGAQIASVALTHLFRVFPELCAPALTIFESPHVVLPIREARRLQAYGILTSSDPVSLKGRMIEDGLKLYIEQQTPSRPIHVAIPQAVQTALRSDDWVEEIAILSGRFNLLEKRLRELVIQVLRMSSLSNKNIDAPRPRDRLLRVLHGAKKRELSARSADDIIKLFTWRELGLLISREWSLLQAIFGDKKKIETTFSILNDRPWAHSKEADVADFALYRREIKWLEDCLAKLD